MHAKQSWICNIKIVSNYAEDISRVQIITIFQEYKNIMKQGGWREEVHFTECKSGKCGNGKHRI